MLNMETLRKESEKAFVEQIRDKVIFLAERCWVMNIKGHLEEINEIIQAGRKMGVTNASQFSEEEIAELVEDLTPLRTLEMKAPARAHLVSALAKKGVDPQIFEGAK